MRTKVLMSLPIRSVGCAQVRLSFSINPMLMLEYISKSMAHSSRETVVGVLVPACRVFPLHRFRTSEVRLAHGCADTSATFDVHGSARAVLDVFARSRKVGRVSVFRVLCGLPVVLGDLVLQVCEQLLVVNSFASLACIFVTLGCLGWVAASGYTLGPPRSRLRAWFLLSAFSIPSVG